MKPYGPTRYLTLSVVQKVTFVPVSNGNPPNGNTLPNKCPFSQCPPESVSSAWFSQDRFMFAFSALSSCGNVALLAKQVVLMISMFIGLQADSPRDGDTRCSSSQQADNAAGQRWMGLAGSRWDAHIALQWPEASLVAILWANTGPPKTATMSYKVVSVSV